jgi:hypothetical protein
MLVLRRHKTRGFYPEKNEEKRYRGCRGPDKKPRNYNESSLFNLKPFRNVSEKMANSGGITENSQNKSSLGRNLLVGIGICILIIIIGYFIWKLYKRYFGNRLN